MNEEATKEEYIRAKLHNLQEKTISEPKAKFLKFLLKGKLVHLKGLFYQSFAHPPCHSVIKN